MMSPSHPDLRRPSQAMTNHRRRRSRRSGFSLIELLIVIAIILIIAAIAVPKFNQIKMNANEMAVIKELETVYNAQTQYYSQFNKYASNLVELGPPTGGAAGPSGADLIPKTLALGEHNGYRYTVAGNPGGFVATAVPVVFGSTGRRTFFMDQSKIVRQNWTQEPANAQSEELK